MSEPMALGLLVDDDGESLYGRCGTCHRRVDNHDSAHRVSSIMRGGKGVECAERGDIDWSETMPLGPRPAPSRSVSVDCIYCFTTAVGDNAEHAHRLMEAHYQADHR